MAATIVALTACNEKKPPTMSHQFNDTVEDVTDTTIYGRLGEDIGMSTFNMITDKGDTLVFVVENTINDVLSDTLEQASDAPIAEQEVVKGGKGIGDRMAVVAYKNSDGEYIVTKAINLTTLLGKWTALDKSFEIKEGGIVVSNFSEPKPYTEWSICNGHLVLSADTFDIFELGADSLLIENKKGIYSYRRQK